MRKVHNGIPISASKVLACFLEANRKVVKTEKRRSLSQSHSSPVDRQEACLKSKQSPASLPFPSV